MKILSLYDGMACGMLAMQDAGIDVDNYDAYEIDKYAIKAATHNFPKIVEHGNVFDEDFRKYEGVDWLIGGSPCTYWSIAQTKNRETEASGLGWELFSQYVRALHEAKPRFFVYENNKSMAKAIRDSIRETFGSEEICINSALVSAQNRQRYYWVGKRNEDGTYSKVDVKQPEDRGILLKDVLDNAMPFRQTANGKGFCMDASYTKTPGSPATFLEGGHARANRSMVAEPVNPDANGKGHCLAGNRGGMSIAHDMTESRHNLVSEPVRVGDMPSNSGHISGAQSKRIYDLSGKSPALVARPRGGGVDGPLYPVRIGCMPSPDGTIKNSQGMRVYAIDGKSTVQTSQGGGLGAKTGLYAVPVNTTEAGKAGTIRATCYKDGIRNIAGNNVDRKTGVAEPVGTTREGKSYCLTAGYANGSGENIGNYVAHTITKGCKSMVAEHIPQYATPCEWDDNGIPTKAISGADGKTYTVYPVQDGQITIKGKTYPIKLVDGYYIIRKLTVSECKRLQTVPEWYDFSCVSATQAYKMLGNGWTVHVISHLIKACMEE